MIYLNSDTNSTHPSPIIGRLVGNSLCIVDGFTTHCDAPVQEMVRLLLQYEYQRDRSLVLYRGEALAIYVNSLTQAENLVANYRGTYSRLLKAAS